MWLQPSWNRSANPAFLDSPIPRRYTPRSSAYQQLSVDTSAREARSGERMIREGDPQFMASNDETKKPNQPRQADSDLEGMGMDELLNLYSKPSLTEGEIIRGK